MEEDECVPDGWECAATVAISECPEGMPFCLHLGRCAMRQECHEDVLVEEEEEEIECPPGLTYCMESGNCETSCGGTDDAHSQEDDGDDGEEVEEEEEEITCPPDTTYCMETGECSPGGCRDGREQPWNEPEETVCPIGKVYCMLIKACVDQGQCELLNDSKGEQEEEKFRCPEGQVSNQVDSGVMANLVTRDCFRCSFSI